MSDIPKLKLALTASEDDTSREAYTLICELQVENAALKAALADIGYSDDMTLEVAVRKARRMCRENSDE